MSNSRQEYTNGMIRDNADKAKETKEYQDQDASFTKMLAVYYKIEVKPKKVDVIIEAPTTWKDEEISLAVCKERIESIGKLLGDVQDYSIKKIPLHIHKDLKNLKKVLQKDLNYVKGIEDFNKYISEKQKQFKELKEKVKELKAKEKLLSNSSVLFSSPFSEVKNEASPSLEPKSPPKLKQQ